MSATPNLHEVKVCIELIIARPVNEVDVTQP